MRRARVLLAVAGALALGGCGLGPGEEREGAVDLVVTRDFGRETVARDRVDPVREDLTVMRLLRSRRHVETRYGGRFVQSIDGLEGRGATGSNDWFFWVNGVESSESASDFELFPGDVVQWDYRDWRATMSIPATVGAYPEPMVHGQEGKRYPVRVECSAPRSDACETAKRRLEDDGVAFGSSSLGSQGTEKIIRIVVGPWRDLRRVTAIERLDEAPEESGVFARFRDDGRRLELLGPRGNAVRAAGAGTGLVAALAPDRDEIIWVVTGTEDAGVEAAAGALRRDALRDAFAVAAGPGAAERLPLEPAQ
jgi:hypothetical protein